MPIEATPSWAHAPSRAQWPRLLAALPAREVRECAQMLTATWQVHDVAIPQSGLGLLQLCDSALGDSYFLGEIPVARAHVRLTREDGTSIEGAAQLLDDRASLARAIAVLDAIKAARWPGHERIDALLHAGATSIEAEAATRRAIVAHTRVDFSLLGMADKEDDDATR
jgi:alpha-D-ribose 1-methylphosphonate 5-triphosphate synthase subunit PhnG